MIQKGLLWFDDNPTRSPTRSSARYNAISKSTAWRTYATSTNQAQAAQEAT
jgi:hypothetical protein